MSVFFTVFTPTYNRAHTLPRLYNSIRQQTFRDFEWIIVDDGSTDDTASLVRTWQTDNNDFDIRYFYQPHQHIKVAYNRGAREARGELCVPVDSDDELLPQTLETFRRLWLAIPSADRDRYVGVTGLRVDDRGSIIGDLFPKSPLDSDSLEIFFKHRVRGDKSGCLRVDVLREFPFPENVPNLVTEALVWFRIAQKYKTRFVNEIVYLVHRDTESVSRPRNLLEAKAKNSEGFLLFVTEVLDKYITPQRLISSADVSLFMAAQYARWFYHAKPETRKKYVVGSPLSRLLVFATWPIGWLWYQADRLELAPKLRVVLTRLGLRLPF